MQTEENKQTLTRDAFRITIRFGSKMTQKRPLGNLICASQIGFIVGKQIVIVSPES